MAEGSDRVPENEFEQWLTPASIAQIMRGHLAIDVWRPLLLKRISDDEAWAAARKVVINGKRHEPEHRVRLPWRYWEKDGPFHIHHDFWETGDVVLTVRRDYSSGPDTKFSCVDVRFDPRGIALLVPRVVKTLAPSPMIGSGDSSPLTDRLIAEEIAFETAQRRAKQPRTGSTAYEFDGGDVHGAGHLSQVDTGAPPPRDALPTTNSGPKPAKVKISELRAWYRALFAENPSLKFDAVKALADAHFRPRPVTRQPLRDVIGELGHTATRGNPAFRRK